MAAIKSIIPANRYDVVVIGGGHNGLTTAALLAKKGRKVVVLEQREVLGGLGAVEEFHEDYRTPGVLHDTTGVRHDVIRALNLERYGLEVEDGPPSVFTPQEGARGILLHHDPERAREEIEEHSTLDAERYVNFRAFIKRVGRVLNSIIDDVPPNLIYRSQSDMMSMLKKGFALRRLGDKDMIELIRVAPMSVADWLDEWFESDILKAALAGPAMHGSFLAPRSPGGALNLLLREARKSPSVKGGPGFLVTALEARRARWASTSTPRSRSRVSRSKRTRRSVCGSATAPNSTRRLWCRRSTPRIRSSSCSTVISSARSSNHGCAHTDAWGRRPRLTSL